MIFKTERFLSRHPSDVCLFVVLRHIAFNARQIAGVFSLQVNYVVDVVPQVVVLRNVSREAALRTLVKSKSVKTADKTHICHVFVSELLLVSELGEGVDDNTEQNVHDDDLHNYKEANVRCKLDPVQLKIFSVVNLLSNVTYATAFQHSIAGHAHEALEHSATSVFTNLSGVVPVKTVVNDSVLHVEE